LDVWRGQWTACAFRRSASLFVAHDLVRKLDTTLGSSPRASFSGSCAAGGESSLWLANLGRSASRERIFISSFRGAAEGREPGIHSRRHSRSTRGDSSARSVVMDSGLAASRRPGMTKPPLAPALSPHADRSGEREPHSVTPRTLTSRAGAASIGAHHLRLGASRMTFRIAVVQPQSLSRDPSPSRQAADF